MFKDFLIRPKPFDDESFIGFIHRVADENYCSPKDALRIAYDFDPSTQFSQETLNRMPDPVKSEFGKNLFNKHFWRAKFPLLFDFSIQKYCIHCVIEKPYIRSVWDFKSYTVCQVHHTSLINKCPMCGESMGVTSVIKKSCGKCNFALSEIESTVSVQDKVSSEIFSLFNNTDIFIGDRLKEIDSRRNQLYPYLQLVSAGSIKSLNDIRKSDLPAYSSAQNHARKLQDDDISASEMLTKQLIDKFHKDRPSFAFNPYRKVINDSEFYQFSRVIRKSITSEHFKSSEQYLTTEFISRLWKVDEKLLISAIDQISPAMKKGNNHIKLSAFANNAERILAICDKIAW